MNFFDETSNSVDGSKLVTNAANLSNGFAIVVSPGGDEDEDQEQLELIDKMHSEFLQHFKNEIRISPQCVDEQYGCSAAATPLSNDELSSTSESWTTATTLDSTAIETTTSRRGSSDGSVKAALRSSDGYLRSNFGGVIHGGGNTSKKTIQATR